LGRCQCPLKSAGAHRADRQTSLSRRRPLDDEVIDAVREDQDECDRNESDEMLVRALEDGVQPPVRLLSEAKKRFASWRRAMKLGDACFRAWIFATCAGVNMPGGVMHRARQFHEKLEARQAQEAALVGQSQACPFDLHLLLSVPDAILQLGPTDPATPAPG
jgi:hypothetical protein